MLRPSPRRAFVAPPRPLQASRASPAFDAQLFLDSAGAGRRVATFQEKETVYSQGDLARDVMYIRDGGVKLTVVNTIGKEAVVAILGPGDFCGESCLGGQPMRTATATAIVPLSVLAIDNKEMLRLLHSESAFFDRFITYMLQRKARIEEDLIDQLFNSSEKRLARTLLLLARYGKQDQPQRVLLTISQETLAEMVGTTRPRVNFFMNKFKRLGYIQYDGGLQINASLLNVVQDN
jgi:CRP/FNR family transcriptional regulator, cyclic AMP receptor protein